MPATMIVGGLDPELVTDIIRFSDGRFDPVYFANEELRSFIQRSVETAPEIWSDRLDEVAQKYAPETWKLWESQDEARTEQFGDEHRPLVWKEVAIPSGSEVRMAYGDRHFYAKVKGGRIIDDGKDYSPSEWARNIANDTSRNAWRDLWFKEPFSKTWVPAQLMREQARADADNRLQTNKSE